MKNKPRDLAIDWLLRSSAHVFTTGAITFLHLGQRCKHTRPSPYSDDHDHVRLEGAVELLRAHGSSLRLFVLPVDSCSKLWTLGSTRRLGVACAPSRNQFVCLGRVFFALCVAWANETFEHNRLGGVR